MILVLAFLFVVLMLVLWQVQTKGRLVALDGAVDTGLAAIRSRAMIAAGTWISQFGTGAAGAVVCLVASGLFWSSDRERLIAPIWIAFLGAEATTWPLKFVTRRARPHSLPGISAESPSFPSAHATVSMVVYGFLALAVAEPAAQDGLGVFAIAGLLIMCVCFSRMLLSLHYFTDVVAGAVVGLFWLVIAWRMAMG